jgi:hypothetical protein
MYLLDTDILSAARKLPREHRAAAWLQRRNTALYMSVVSAMEIERAIEKQRRVDPPFAAALETWFIDTLESFADRVLPITTQIGRRWGRLQIQLGRADSDLPIAATAIEHGLQIVTRNTKDFRATGVTIINPFDIK